jgi:ABC-type uncharacterized transport system substrate-binding protein
MWQLALAYGLPIDFTTKFEGNNHIDSSLKEVEIAAGALGVQIQSSDVRDANSFEHAFDAATRQRANAVLVQRDPLNNSYPTRIVALAAKHKLPGMYPGIQYVNAGGLMSYGVSTVDLYRRAATYIDKILKGAKPADLPVEQQQSLNLSSISKPQSRLA